MASSPVRLSDWDDDPHNDQNPVPVKIMSGDGSGDEGVAITRIEQYTAPVSGEHAGSVAAVNLPNVPCKLVRIKAQNDNAGNVYIGTSAAVTKAAGTTDATTGLQLDAGDDTGWIPTDNLNRFWLISDNAGDDITYLALN